VIVGIVSNKLATAVKSISGANNVTLGVVDDFALDACWPSRIRLVWKFWHFVVAVVTFAEFFANSKVDIVSIREDNGRVIAINANGDTMWFTKGGTASFNFTFVLAIAIDVGVSGNVASMVGINWAFNFTVRSLLEKTSWKTFSTAIIVFVK